MCPSLSSILRGPSACIITSSSLTKVSKSTRNKLKNYFTLTKVPVKESKVGFRRHKLISMFYRRNSMRVRISFADSTRRNNRYRRSFGWIHPTNETNLFPLWFSFFTQEERPFYHDKTVNIKLILVPRGCDPFGQRHGSRPLAGSDPFSSLIGQMRRQ